MDQNPIEQLRMLLSTQGGEHEPWTSGKVKLNEVESMFFFKSKDDSARFLKLGSTSAADERALVDACSPAPFGRGAESVLDETYRKALKMESAEFSWKFNPSDSKFIAKLAHGLCPWDKLRRGVRLELSKLNVYEKGGFFKSHRDTPRAEDMFGTLVFILPFAHKGGDLLLCHDERKFTFKSTLKSYPSNTVSYVAFYSDVEHEVREITAGNRVTVTYNLHFDNTKVPTGKPKVPENLFATTFRSLLRDPAFVRSFKYLGFGLSYSYPKSADQYGGELERHLKGRDAMLFSILRDLGLEPELKYLYCSGYNGGNCGFWVMRDDIFGDDYMAVEDQDELDTLLGDDEEERSHIVWSGRKDDDEHPWVEAYDQNPDYYQSRTLEVEWVIKPNNKLQGESTYPAYGNEPTVGTFYYDVCIIVDISEVPCPPRKK